MCELCKIEVEFWVLESHDCGSMEMLDPVQARRRSSVTFNLTPEVYGGKKPPSHSSAAEAKKRLRRGSFLTVKNYCPNGCGEVSTAQMNVLKVEY